MPLDDELKVLFENFGTRCSELEYRMSALENTKDPDVLHGRINNIISAMESMSDKIQQVFEKVFAMDLDKRFIERFSDDDLKNYYLQSGLTLKEIKSYLDEHVLEKPADVTELSRWINGETTNLELRNAIGKHLRGAALTRVK